MSGHIKIGAATAQSFDLFRSMGESLASHGFEELADDIQWLARTTLARHQQGKHNAQRLYYVDRATGLFIPANPHPNVPAVFWNGSSFKARAWPGADAVWLEDYRALAGKVLGATEGHPTTIIDLGCGLGVLTFHIALLARERGVSVQFINIDHDESGLNFCQEFARRHNIAVQTVQADLSHTSSLAEVVRQWSGPKLLVARGVLSIFSDEQNRALLDSLIKAGVTAGVHLEQSGAKTATYQRVVGRFKTYPPPPDNPDPLALISRIPDMNVVERIEVWPHFPGLRLSMVGLWPSFLAWSRLPGTSPPTPR